MKLTVDKPLNRQGHNAAIYCLEAFGQGSFISAGGEGLIVQWWSDDREDGQALAKLEEQIFSLLHLEEEGTVVCGAFSGHLYFIDLDRPEEPRRFEFHRGGVYCLAMVNGVLVVGGGDGKVSFWDPSKLQIIESVWVSHKAIRSIFHDVVSDQLVLGTSDGCIYFMDAAERTVTNTLENAHTPSVFSTCMYPSGDLLISGGRDAKIRRWVLEENNWNLQLTLDAHWFTVNHLISLFEGNVIASASRDKTIRLWDQQSLEPLLTLDRQAHHGHVNSVNRLLWLPEQQYLVSASDDRQILLWHIRDSA